MLRSKSFPCLSKMVKALLAYFGGPVVESSFNLMGDIIDERRGKMSMETFSAFQTFKYALNACGKSCLQMFNRQDILRDPVSQPLIKNMTSACSSYHAVLDEEKAKKEDNSRRFELEKTRVHCKLRAIEATRNSSKKARLGHQKRQAVMVVKKKAW